MAEGISRVFFKRTNFLGHAAASFFGHAIASFAGHAKTQGRKALIKLGQV